MLLKKADDKATDLQILDALLKQPGTPPETCKLIEREIRNIRAGLKGEAETAYELEFNFHGRNWLIIHDLRIEHKGRIAQIDHLLLNRFLQVFVCESKRFSEGVAINAQGEFAAFFGSKPYGIPSPIEQNRRHILVLDEVFNSGAIDLPRRLGFKLKPELESFILVSKSARISRPKTAIAGLANVIKTDQFVSRINKDMDASSPLKMAKVISPETLEALGQQLIALHKPIVFDWAAKFGLTPAEASIPHEAAVIETAPDAPVEPAAAELTTDAAPAKSKLVCSNCAAAVSYNVAKFCWNNRRFQGKVFCMDCQPKQ